MAYGHQALLVQIALSGIRHDFPDICTCEFDTAEPFTTIRALGHMWWTMGIMRTTYSGDSQKQRKSLLSAS